MERKTYTADFATLKKAYLEVKGFLEEESWENVKSLSTTVENDLGLYGDDNYYMLIKFIDKYQLEEDGFDYSTHFLSEGELFNSGTMFLHLLLLPLYIIKLISFGKINLLPPPGYWDSETTPKPPTLLLAIW
ncbi:hypothetical protein ACLI09_13890 [Flavobacterium sp. RHBU_24]|uniref:hypothetical protein n=1 Tax=Flavobacterium sp. RHBU_24 TaxID=3391185 RepID=UPI00398563EF